MQYHYVVKSRQGLEKEKSMVQMSEVLVLVALELEIAPGSWKFDCPVAYTGVGKVNAALVAHQAITKYKPKLLVNLGTAGTLDAKLQGICEVSSVIQRDFDTFPLAPRGTIPFQEKPSEFTSSHGKYRCGTGDTFMTQKDSWVTESNIKLVDMELYSIAQAGYMFGIPWRSAKFITDVVGENSSNDWQSQLKIANEELQSWFGNRFQNN
jgi:adenosylhomocysteine nucleosidase